MGSTLYYAGNAHADDPANPLEFLYGHDSA